MSRALLPLTARRPIVGWPDTHADADGPGQDCGGAGAMSGYSWKR